MKASIIFLILCSTIFMSVSIEANYSTKAISGQDTMLVIVKKNLNEALNSFAQYENDKIYLTALPDTTRDVIIIFKNFDFEDSDLKIAEEAILKKSETKLSEGYSVSNIFKG